MAQTRDEVGRLNEAIRQRLLTAGQLSDPRRTQTVQDVGSTVAARSDPASYAQGEKIVFLRAYGRFARGNVVDVLQATESGLLVEKDGRRSRIGYKQAERFSVARSVEIDVSVGERLQLKFNGRSVEGHHIANGEMVTVLAHRPDGGLFVRDDHGQTKSLGADQRHFNLGYAVTSYGSQGKTVDTVLFSDSGNLAATSQKQWYVTISRGRKKALVFTDDVDRLRQALKRSGDRKLASELEPVGRETTQKYLEIAAMHRVGQTLRERRAKAIRPTIIFRHGFHTG